MNNDQAFALLSGVAMQHHAAVRRENLIAELEACERKCETMLIDIARMLQKPRAGQGANEIAADINLLLERVNEHGC